MKPTRILVIPGIGDVHWVSLKLKSFCAINGIDDPEVWVWNFDDRPRSLEFVQRLPFVTAGGYWNQPLTDAWRLAFEKCYMLGMQDVVAPFGEFDYFICVNGSLRMGRTLQYDILPECKTDWEYQLRTTPAELNYGDEQASRDKYVLLYFSDQGMFRFWLNRWPSQGIADFLDALSVWLPEYRLLLTGSSWDEAFAKQVLSHTCAPIENLVGQTNFDQFMGLLRHASGFAGWCGGNTIVSTHIGIPTYMFWSDYFCREMQTNWVDPSKIGTVYNYDNVASVRPKDAAERFALQVRSAA